MRCVNVTNHMDNPTAPIDWRTVLREQGRTIAWLADQTRRPRRTVYAYSRDDLIPLPEWLETASAVLGVQVEHARRESVA